MTTTTGTPCALEHYPLLAGFILSVWPDIQPDHAYTGTDVRREWRGLRFGAISVIGVGSHAGDDLRDELNALAEVMEMRL